MSMNSNSQNLIEFTESYISPQALPFEQINCWLRWNDHIDYDEIVITFPSNISTTHFLNVDERVFKEYTPSTEKCIIKKEWVQVNGFFGMKCYYQLIPDIKIKLEFSVVLRKKQQDKTILKEKLVTTVTRPRIDCKNISTNQFTINEYDSQISLKLKLQLEIVDNPNVRNIRGIQKIVTGGKDIKIKIKEENLQIPEIAIEPIQIQETLIITGKGMAVFQLEFEYEDYVANKYRTSPIEITIEKSTFDEVSIPIQRVMKSDAPLLVASWRDIFGSTQEYKTQ